MRVAYTQMERMSESGISLCTDRERMSESGTYTDSGKEREWHIYRGRKKQGERKSERGERKSERGERDLH